MSDLEELAKRVEALTGPCRTTDCHTMMAIHSIPDVCGGRLFDEDEAPAYTASTDAAMTLLPEGWLKLERQKDGWSALGLTGPWCRATTPALAICVAALRALATLQSTGDEG